MQLNMILTLVVAVCITLCDCAEVPEEIPNPTVSEGHHAEGRDGRYSECWKTGCHESRMPVIGCGQYGKVSVANYSCENGLEYDCCNDTLNIDRRQLNGPDNPIASIKPGTEEDLDGFYNVNEAEDAESIPEYVDYVKALLRSSRDFSFDAAPFPCTDLDPTKKFVVEDGEKDAIRICDMCPFLPFEKLANRFVNLEAVFEIPNSGYAECIVTCLNVTSCVAVSYDTDEKKCYAFNSTAGEIKDQSGYVTVFITQPKGVLSNWLYTRSTKIQGNETKQLVADNFIKCVDLCRKDKGDTFCNAVSYEFSTKNCALYNAENIKNVDYVYGHVTAFHLNLIHANQSNNWRFTQYSSLLEPEEKKNATIAARAATSEFGTFYNPSCIVQSYPDCDRSGFQKCYYPEYDGRKKLLRICPDSLYAHYERDQLVKYFLDECMNKCTDTETCQGVDFSTEDQSCCLLDYSALLTSLAKGNNPHILANPLNDSKRENHFNQFFNVEIVALPESSNNHVITFEAISLDQCLRYCGLTCAVASFNFKSQRCMISTGASTTQEENNSVTFSKIRDLDSPLLGFVSYLSTGAVGTGFIHFNDECPLNICQENLKTCLATCLLKEACNFVGVKYEYRKPVTRIHCTLYSSETTILGWDPDQEVYARVAQSLSLTLSDLDKMSALQPNDFWSCFKASHRQTQSTLEANSTELESSSMRSLRIKRGFLDFLKSAFEIVAEIVVDQLEFVRDQLKTTAKVYGKLWTGDFTGAANTLLEVPVIRDYVVNPILNGIELVKNVKDGNWEEAGKNVLDLGIDIVGYIPGGGKVAQVTAKVAKKTVKAIAKRVIKNVKLKVKPKPKPKPRPKPPQKGQKPNKGKKGKKKGEKKECPKKPKRSAIARAKPGSSKPGSSKPNSKKDSCKTPKCTTTGVMNIERRHKRNCKNKSPRQRCEFMCDAGYEETSVNPECKAGTGNSKPFYQPSLKCTPLTCPLLGSHVPVDIKAYHTLLKHLDVNDYFVKFNKKRRLPVYSATFHDILQYQRANLFQLTNLNKRSSDSFTAHPCSPLKNAQPGDKENDFKMTKEQVGTAEAAGEKVTSWDRGHLTPFESHSYTYKSAISTNLFVNTAPQDPHTHQGPWKKVEAAVMCQLRYTPGIVITGLCEQSVASTDSGLDVPSCYWKLVCTRNVEDGATVVYGYIADNSLVFTPSDKKARSIATKTIRSQRDVVERSEVQMDLLWAEAAKYIYKGKRHGVVIAPDPFSCARAKDLHPKFSEPKSGNKNQIFGCSDSELEETEALFNSDVADNDTAVITGEDKGGVLPRFSGTSCGKRLIGYFPSWGTTRFTNVQGNALTHAVFAFFQTMEDGSIVLGSANPVHTKNYTADVKISKKRLANFRRIKESFPHLKTMFSIGGWEDSTHFSSIAADPQKRLKLIGSAVEIIDTYHFDGIDINWQHPVTGGRIVGVLEDRENFVTLLEELRGAFNEYEDGDEDDESDESKSDESESVDEKSLLISFTGAALQGSLDGGYDLPLLLQYADWANVMSYDYYGGRAIKWGSYTGSPSPLYFGNPKGFSGKANADWSLKNYVCKTQQPHKINMGVPFYGRFWTNVNDPVDPKDPMFRKAQQITGSNAPSESGFATWKEIKEKWLTDPGFKVTMHEKTKAPYAWNANNTFLGFESPESLAVKVKYAENKNLGGFMIWAIDDDDDDNSMLKQLLASNLCTHTDPDLINYHCPPTVEKRWWLKEDGDDKAGTCGKKAPIFGRYHPVCDPDDPGYGCCGGSGQCGSGSEFCDCPTCVNYQKYPQKIFDEGGEVCKI